MPSKVEAGEASVSDHDPLLALVGSRIRAARRRAKLTQTQVAVKIGTRQSVIVSVEAGQQNITLKLLGRIAACFGVPPATFLLEGEMALAADEGGFEQLAGVLRLALNDTERVADVLREALALVSSRAATLKASSLVPDESGSSC